MNKNFWILFLAAATVTLGTTAVWQNIQMKRIKQAYAEERAAIKEQVELLVKSTQAKPKKKASVPARSVEAEQGRPEHAVTTSAEPPQPVFAQAGMGSNLMGAVAEMMKNPQMKEMMRTQQKVMVDQMYASLPRYLNLSAETKERLSALLLERHLAMSEVGMTMMGGSEEERKIALEKSQTVKASCDQAIKELLGDPDYEVFSQYEQSIPEQTHVTMFKNSLSSDDNLSEQQEYDLVTAMYQARKDLPQDTLLNQQNQAPDPSQLTEERIAETLKQMDVLQQRYAEGAAAILNSEQLDRFKQWQQQMANMQRAGLNIAAQMFGQGKSGSVPSQK